MKKYFLALSMAVICLLIASCAGGGCSIEGIWMVSDVKIETSKLSESITKLMESEYSNTIYQFNSDGTMSMITSNNQESTGIYSLDLEGKTLKWNDDEIGTESKLTINSCSNDAFSLTQRMPSDPSREATAIITMTIVPNRQ